MGHDDRDWEEGVGGSGLDRRKKKQQKMEVNEIEKGSERKSPPKGLGFREK